MNHDAAHCIAADGRCPKDCYRFQLTEEYEEYLRMGMRLPVSWSDFEGTDECMKEGQDGSDKG